MPFFKKFKKSIRDMYIARADEAVGQLIWRYPEQDIPNGSKLTVRSDETVLFFREGRFAGSLEAGSYILNTQNIPFLSDLILSDLTGHNAYICELFFVRHSEHIHQLQKVELGTYLDQHSRHVVTLNCTAKFSVQVHDSLKLLLTLGGQSEHASNQIHSFLNSRLRGLLASAVGEIMVQRPALEVVSSVYNEEIGRLVREKASAELFQEGVDVKRLLEVHLELDNESEDALRDFGSKQAELGIQREGAQLAGSFASYQLASGHRSALEGLGDGLASGKGSFAGMIGLGGGLPANHASRAPRPPSILESAARTGSTVLDRRNQAQLQHKGVTSGLNSRWLLELHGTDEGPYSARQLVLRVLSLNMDPHEVIVKSPRDGSRLAMATVHVLMEEVARREAKSGRSSQQQSPVNSTKLSQFETGLQIALSDEILTVGEIQMLANLALEARLVRSVEDGRALVIARARVRGCKLPDES